MPLIVTSQLAGPSAGQRLSDALDSVTGTVQDINGQGIAGADVRLVTRFENPDPFAASAEALLRGHPLPAARSNRDGTFALAILPELRTVAQLGLSWSLVVAHDGYETWYEHFDRGLVDYLGSRATLRPIDAADEVEFVAEGALAGTGITVLRGHEVRFLPVDARGHVRVRLPRVPCPVQPPSPGGVIDVEWYVRASPPGFSSPPIVTRPRHILTRTGAPPLRVARRDGGEVVNPRALVRTAASNRWVALPDGTWPSVQPPLAFAADGCRMSATTDLEPLPPRPPGVLQLVDERGTPVTGAHALLIPAGDWRPRVQSRDHHPPPGEPPGLVTLTRRPLAAAAGGSLDLDLLPVGEPVVLVVVGEGFEPLEVLDPRGLDERALLVLRRRQTSSVEVLVHDEAGVPLAGALVALSDAADVPAALLGARVVTGADGRAAFRGAATAACKAFGVKEGYVGSVAQVRHERADVTVFEVALPRAQRLAFFVRDAEDAPVPFAQLQRSAAQSGNGRATRDYVFGADSMGRVCLNGPIEQILDLRQALDLSLPERDGEFGVLRIARPEAVLVRQRQEQRFRTRLEVWQRDRLVAPRPGLGDVLVLASEGDRVAVHLQPQGMACLDDEGRRGLPREPLSGIRIWDVDFPVLDLAFASPLDDRSALTAVPIELEGTSRRRLAPFRRLPAERVIAYRDEDATWRLLDPDATAVCLFHPRCAPVTVDLSLARRRGQKPIRLALEPGSPLRVEVARGHPVLTNVSVAVVCQVDGHRLIVRHEFERLAADARTDPELPCTVTLPALPAGAWKVAVEAHVPPSATEPDRRLAFECEGQADGARPVEVSPPR